MEMDSPPCRDPWGLRRRCAGTAARGLGGAAGPTTPLSGEMMRRSRSALSVVVVAALVAALAGCGGSSSSSSAGGASRDKFGGLVTIVSGTAPQSADSQNDFTTQ